VHPSSPVTFHDVATVHDFLGKDLEEVDEQQGTGAVVVAREQANDIGDRVLEGKRRRFLAPAGDRGKSQTYMPRSHVDDEVGQGQTQLCAHFSRPLAELEEQLEDRLLRQ